MIKIYTLAHPLTKEIRYIGKTKYSLNDRLCKHLITYERNHRANWIRSILKMNLKPIIELLDEVSNEEWITTEKYWISQFKTWGFRLLNATEGGESGIISQQCRAAHKLKVKGSKRKKSSINLTIEKLNKPILQYDIHNNLIAEFVSASEAGRKTNTHLSHITECCNSRPKRKTANGYIWKYKIKI